MIHIKNLNLEFSEQVIFNSVNTIINQNDQIGLVGRNGAGKSTLLKIIANEMQADSGIISIAKKTKLAYMPQEVVITSQKTILEETLSSLGSLFKLHEEKQQLTKRIAQDSCPLDINKYAEIEHSLSESNFDEKKAEAQKILSGLGFTNQEQLVSNLSVGWRMRVVLAKLLLQDADFYLFDEPTNHLDLSAKNWFLNFLQQSNFGFLLVCHDKYFLNKACSATFELSQGNLNVFAGNYEYYTKQKEILNKQLEQAYKKQQDEIRQKELVISRFRSKASKAKMAQSMIKSLQKMNRIELEEKPSTIHLNFKVPQKSGRHVLQAKNLSHSFKEKLFDNISCEIERADKIALVAPNGTGKTTLFNIIAQKLPLQSGTITFGHNVTTSLFDQDQEKILHPKKTILEEVSDQSNATEQEIRSILGSLLFNENDIQKKCSVLSGGERNRVAMAKVALSNANFLLLDEPTNHLDIESKEIILQALQNFKGTVFFVSHDQDFVNRLATKIIELSAHRATLYLGNYDHYLERKQETIGQPKNSTNTSHKSSQKKSKELFELQKKCKNLEKKITTLEQKLQRCLTELSETEYGIEKYTTLEKEYKLIEENISAETTKWEQLLLQIEGIS